MKQGTLKLNLSVKKTRKQLFLGQMEQVVPWGDLVELIKPYYPEGKTRNGPKNSDRLLSDKSALIGDESCRYSGADIDEKTEKESHSVL